MNTRIIAIWFFLIIVLLSLWSLYRFENDIEPIIEWVDRIAMILPGVIIFLGSIAWATKNESHRSLKVIGGVAVSGVTCFLMWHMYFSNFKEILNNAQDKVNNGLYIIICTGVLALALFTYRKK